MINRFAGGFLAAVIFVTAAASAEAPQQSNILCPDRTLAEKGEMMDEYYLGKAYDEGYCDITTNKSAAENWYRKAALQGHMLAQYELGETFFAGDGLPIDYPEAKKWYEKAGDQGHGLSQLRLGFLNAEAHFPGLTTDYEKAEDWFMKAADQNAGDAQFRLGNFYNNYKQPPDYSRGFIWLKRAAEGGHRVAMYDLARMLLSGRGVAKNIPLGLEWMQKAAEADMLPAQMNLAEMYGEGKDGVTKNIAQSLKWLLKVAAKPTASVFYLNKAGDVFFEGWETVPKNYPAARKYYERAAAKNDPHAIERLAAMYEEGLGVEKNPAKAQEYREKLAAIPAAIDQEPLAPAPANP